MTTTKSFTAVAQYEFGEIVSTRIYFDKAPNVAWTFDDLRGYPQIAELLNAVFNAFSDNLDETLDLE